MNLVSLLGPQRHRPTVGAALDALELDGPVAAITAGWQEREGEIDELEEHVGRPVVQLELYRRAEVLASRDAELFDALRRRQTRLRRLQRLYRVRLDPTLAAARDLLQHAGEDEQLEAARRGALRALRVLDDEHVDGIRDLHRRFEQRWPSLERPAVAAHRDELRELLRGCSALLIAGGHVAVLVNRLRLFGGLELLAEVPAVVAWSAGAMALAERIVLFHDSPPQGAGNAEVLDVGLGAIPGILPLPDARRRLRLGDPLRVGLFCRRFDPLRCLMLDDGSQVMRRDGVWSSARGSECLGADGSVERCFEPEDDR